MKHTCTHKAQITLIDDMPMPHSGCASCVASGDTWVHLRRCMTCGRIGCCDDSKNRHATLHFEEMSHPIVKSMEQDWLWCFIDRTFL